MGASLSKLHERGAQNTFRRSRWLAIRRVISSGYIHFELGLGPQLARSTLLQHLDLSFHRIGEQGTTALGPNFALLTLVTHLQVSETNLGDRGATALAPHLVILGALQYLDIRGNGILAKGA